MNNLVVRIEALLKERKNTNKDLCNIVGINTASITDWKRRGTIPSADIALKIADYLGVSLRYLVFGIEDENQPLTQEEKQLLAKWKQVDKTIQDTIMDLLDLNIERQEKKDNRSEQGLA